MINRKGYAVAFTQTLIYIFYRDIVRFKAKHFNEFTHCLKKKTNINSLKMTQSFCTYIKTRGRVL